MIAGSAWLIKRGSADPLWGLGIFVMALWIIWEGITMLPLPFLGIKLLKVRTVTRCKCIECGHKWLSPEEIAAAREQLPPVPRPAEARPSKLARDAEADERIESLIQTLRDRRLFSDRRGAAKALGEIGEARAVEPLIEALEDKQILVRIEAAKALGKIGDTRAVEPLIKALKNVPEPAAESLGQIGDPRAVEPLIGFLRHAPPKVRMTVAEALGEIGDARALGPLTQALEDEKRHVREAAGDALEKIKSKKTQSNS
jgi:HEAT repeat protein